MRGARAPQATAGGFFQFTPSNDLYGSFCRVRVSLQSDDKKIQDVIAKGTDWAVTYFAAGDAFTCGSWIPEKSLNDLANAVAKDARDEAAKGNGRTRTWMTLLGTVGGGGLGAWGGNKIADSSFLGGLTGSGSTKDNNSNAESCVNAAEKYISTGDTACLTRMLNYARKIDDKETSDKKQTLDDAYKALRDEMIGITPSTSDSDAYKCDIVVRNGNANTALVARNKNRTQKFILRVTNCTSQNLSDKSCIGATDVTNPTEQDLEFAPFAMVAFCESGVTVNDVNAVLTNKTYADYANKNTELNIKKSTTTSASSTAQTSNLATKVTALSDACDAYTNNKSNQKTKSISTAVGAGVGAIAGGVLAYQATKSIQDAKLDKVEKEAYDEWMNEVGQHIRCFVGGDEVGMFGDTITTSME